MSVAGSGAIAESLGVRLAGGFDTDGGTITVGLIGHLGFLPASGGLGFRTEGLAGTRMGGGLTVLHTVGPIDDSGGGGCWG